MEPEVQQLEGGKPDWLLALTQDPADKSAVHRVGELLPADFEVYLRLFHPFGPWITDETAPIDDGRRTWHSLAREAGVEFHAELQWGSLRPVLPQQGEGRRYAVAEGEVEPFTRRVLFEHLAVCEPNEPTYFLYDLSAIILGRDPALMKARTGDIEQVVAWAEAHELAASSTPEYVWPQGRSWVLCTDYDLASTYIACARCLGEVLLAEPRLEIEPVRLQTRVDDRADVINQSAPPP